MKNKKNYFLVIIVSFLFCTISIGYALYGKTLTLNGNVLVKEAGKLEIISANIIESECSNLTSYNNPTWDNLHIVFNINSDNTNFTATYLITVANNSLWDYTYTGFPISASIQGYDYIPVVTSSITYSATGNILQNGDLIKSGQEIIIKLQMTFSIDRTQGDLTFVVNGDFSASVDNSGSLTAGITPKNGNLKGEGTIAEFTLSVINTFKYRRTFSLSSSNENIEIVDINGNIIKDLVIEASSESSYTIYLRVKEGSIFLTDKTTTNIIISSSMIDPIDTGTIDLDVDIDITATDHEKPVVGNVNIAISTNNPIEGEATISWTRIDTGGSPITNYNITLVNSSTGEIQYLETGNAITSYVVSNLSEGDYYASVSGVDEAGNSGSSDCVNASTNDGYCSMSNTIPLKWRFNITTSLNKLTFSGANSALIYSKYEGVLSVSGGGAYSLPETITVTMSGINLVNGTDYTYDVASGSVVINKITGDVNIEAEAGNASCLVEGTKIRLANGEYKNVEDVNYNDLLLVYDHENGGLTYEYPIWIELEKEANYYQKTTFSDGSILETVGAHNIFNIDKLKYVNINNPSEFKIGDRVAKIDKEGNIEVVSAIKIEYIFKEVKYYHIASTRYYNVLANDFITTDGLEISSFLYSYNKDITWGIERDNYLSTNDFFKYEDWKMFFPEYLFKGLRMEEAKNIYNHGLLDANHIIDILDINNTKPLIKDENNNTLWMVTTSDDTLNTDNYLYKQNDYYTLKEPLNKENFIGWLNTSDNKLYYPGDTIRVIYGMHFIAKYAK